jgi:hypothetical protein
MTNFLLLNPDFFFDVSGPAQKAVLVPFFWGGFYDLFLFPHIFFNLQGISVGALSESKMLKLAAMYGNPQNRVLFIVKRAGDPPGILDILL